MANRMISKMKNLNLKFIPDSKASKGTASMEFHDEDLEDVSRVEDDDILKSDYMNKAGKCAVTAAAVESAYKAASWVEIANTEGLGEAEDRWRSKIGVSGSDASLEDVEDCLNATIDVLKKSDHGNGSNQGTGDDDD